MSAGKLLNAHQLAEDTIQPTLLMLARRPSARAVSHSHPSPVILGQLARWLRRKQRAIMRNGDDGDCGVHDHADFDEGLRNAVPFADG